MPPVRPLYPQKQTFEWQRPLFDPFLPLHPWQRTCPAVSPFVPEYSLIAVERPQFPRFQPIQKTPLKLPS